MPFVILLLVALAFGGLGFWRGGMRIGLALAPLLLASILLWLLAGPLYRIDGLRNLGLIWPALIPLLIGLIIGYSLQFMMRKKLPKELHIADRVSGSVIGFLMAVVTVWLGLVYTTVLKAQNTAAMPGSSATLARTLNNGVVRWIPGVGAGSQATMALVDVATAEEDVQVRAAETLGLTHLLDSPAMQRVLDDPKVVEDVQAASRGNIAALYRLQNSDVIKGLFEDPDVVEVIDRLTPKDIAQAVDEAKNPDGGTPKPEDDQ